MLADRNNTVALDFYRKIGWQVTELICLRRREPKRSTLPDAIHTATPIPFQVLHPAFSRPASLSDDLQKCNLCNIGVCGSLGLASGQPRQPQLSLWDIVNIVTGNILAQRLRWHIQHSETDALVVQFFFTFTE